MSDADAILAVIQGQAARDELRVTQHTPAQRRKTP